MASPASISPHSCEAPPPFPSLPLIISESLRSAVSSNGPSMQGVVSILLSAADFAKLDLSNIQLFSVDGLAMEPMASSEVISPQTEIETSPEEDFSFHTPLVRSPAADLPSSAFPILKSKAVVEAEKASAEHQLLKLGAVSPSPRARKKAVSMDEMSLTENVGNVRGSITEQSNGGVGIARARVRARRQLPELELAALPPPGLQQRAETLRKKHFERVLSRTLSEIRSEEAKVDLKASPATKFLLQVMPWELTPPITPVTTPAGIPFIWEDVPGRPKPQPLPSPCSSLPLPPRLHLAPPPSAPSASSSSAATTGTLASPSSDSAKFFLQPADGKQLSPAKSNPSHGRTHRKNMHSWHVLHNLFSGSYQRCSSHAVDPSLETHPPASEPNNLYASASETSRDGVSSGSTSGHSKSTSFDLPTSTATGSEDAFSPCESSFGSRYELPPIYVAPVVPLTPPHRDLGPLEDGCGKQANRFSYLARLFRPEKCQWSNTSRKGSFSSYRKHGKVASESKWYLLGDANRVQRRIGYDMQTDKRRCKTRREDTSATRSAQMSPIDASLYRSPKPSKWRIQIGSGRMKVFLRLRRRGARVIVGSYKAIKQALFLGRETHSKLFNHTQLPYHTLRR